MNQYSIYTVPYLQTILTPKSHSHTTKQCDSHTVPYVTIHKHIPLGIPAPPRPSRPFSALSEPCCATLTSIHIYLHPNNIQHTSRTKYLLYTSHITNTVHTSTYTHPSIFLPTYLFTKESLISPLSKRMRLSNSPKAASFLLSQSQSLSPLIRSSNATATAAAATATRTLTLTALPKRTGKVPFEEEEILLQDNNNNNNESHLSSKKNVFYPVSPGDVVAEGKYSMISKLGWGRNSTVWLAEERGRWPGRGRWRYVPSFFFFCLFIFLGGSVMGTVNRAHVQ